MGSMSSAHDFHATGVTAVVNNDAGGTRTIFKDLSFAVHGDAIRLPWSLKIRVSQDHEAAEQKLPDSLIRSTLDSLGCDDIDLARAVQDLSGGQAARVSLTRTLLTHPGVLLADEVDAGLDEENADKVADILRKAADNGTAVVRIRHRKPDGRANRIMVLANGTISPLKTAQSAPSTHTEV